MGLSVTVLGCAGSRYDPETNEPCSGYLVETQSSALLLDCGYGTFDSYREFTWGLDLCAIVVSHAHRDHFADLAQFVDSTLDSELPPVVVASPATLAVLSDTLGAIDAPVAALEDGGRAQCGPFDISFSTTTHQIPTLASRVRAEGGTLVYSADTGPGWNVPSEWRRPGLALIECTEAVRTTSRWPYHLDVEDFVALSRVLDAQRTILTHVPPGEDASQRRESAQRLEPAITFDLAERGGRFEVPVGAS